MSAQPEDRPPSNDSGLPEPGEWKRIGPVEAQYILDHMNENNRSLREEEARKLAAAMKAGLWSERLGNPLMFDTTGRMVQGQHRMRAVVISGCTLWFRCVYETSENEFHAATTCVPHRLADSFRMAGLGSSTAQVATFNMALHFPRNPKRLTPYQAVQSARLYPRLWGLCGELNSGMVHQPGIATASTFAPLVRAIHFNPVHTARVRRFADVLTSGMNGQDAAEVTIQSARAWLITHAQDCRGERRKQIYLVVQQALCNYIAGRAVSKMVAVDQDAFPLKEETPQS